MYLNEADPYYVEAKRVQDARDMARTLGNEVLTPRGAQELFGKSREAVRKAVRLGRIYAPFELWFSERSVRLISLESAMDYWKRGDDFDFDERLEQWRAEAHVLYAGGQTWNVLHPTELVTLRYPIGEME